MTLKELAKETKWVKGMVKMIGIYTGPNDPIYPDFADEYLETHDNKTVKDHEFFPSKNVLVVEF